MRYRLLALDLDGTALDPSGVLTEGVKGAIAEVQRRGIEVVLCTGRRFRTARPLARELSLEGPIVVHNGVVVKDIEAGTTLQANYLDREVYARALAIIRELACSPLLYVDRFESGFDAYTERVEEAHPFQREYLAEQSQHIDAVPDVDAFAGDDVIMVSTMADDETVSRLRERARTELGERVMLHSLQNKNYQGFIQEFLSERAGKWPALRQLAAERGVAESEIVAIGDDVNDAEMIRGAGLGIAMGNAVRAAKSAADMVVRSNAEGGVVEALERVILKI